MFNDWYFEKITRIGAVPENEGLFIYLAAVLAIRGGLLLVK